MMNEKDVMFKLAMFFLEKNGNDPAKALQELASYLITKIEVSDKLTIHLSRIGKFIGAKGKQINALSKFLGMEVCLIEVRDHPLDKLYSVMINEAEGRIEFDKFD